MMKRELRRSETGRLHHRLLRQREHKGKAFPLLWQKRFSGSLLSHTERTEALYLGLPQVVLVAVLVSRDQLLAFSKNKLGFRSVARLELLELDALCSLDHDR